MKKRGLNQRELYYFFIKMGAPKNILNEISEVSKKITPQSIENVTQDLTIEEYNNAVQDIKNLTLNKEKNNTEHDISD